MLNLEITNNNIEIIDITPTISEQMAVFPGDTPFSTKRLLDMNEGDNLTLSVITTTVHIGAHTDAPNHYNSTGDSIENRSLNYYMGAAQVIEVNIDQGMRIQITDVERKKIVAPRVLFKTQSFPDANKWNSDFVALSADLIYYLSKQGVILVGIDTPSIDPADDQILESHCAVFKNNMAILEGVILKDVAEGVYNLIALPLKIKNADATPVRAILIKNK